MTYREQSDVALYEERYHDVVLQQRSTFGFWIVLSLGLTLMLVIAYLIYITTLAPAATVASVERSLHVLTTPVPTPFLSLPALTKSPNVKRHSRAVTVIPQSRAANALLGGQGPALLSEETWAAP